MTFSDKRAQKERSGSKNLSLTVALLRFLLFGEQDRNGFSFQAGIFPGALSHNQHYVVNRMDDTGEEAGMTALEHFVSNTYAREKLSADTMAALWHPTKNGDLKPTDITPGSRKAVWWQCERGHAWRAPAYSIKAGTSCPYCSGRNPIVGETDLASTHPQLLALWSEKNKLHPTEVTAGSHKKILWSCEKIPRSWALKRP